MTGTYPVNMFCTNCDWTGPREIPVGVLWRYYAEKNECPVCDCNTLTKGNYSVAPLFTGGAWTDTKEEGST